MGRQRAECPYCGKYTKELYYSEAVKQRALVHCAHCGKTFYVLFGDGIVRAVK